MHKRKTKALKGKFKTLLQNTFTLILITSLSCILYVSYMTI